MQGYLGRTKDYEDSLWDCLGGVCGMGTAWIVEMFCIPRQRYSYSPERMAMNEILIDSTFA